MKCADGVWFPDSEIHLVKMLRGSPRVDCKGTYQVHKLRNAMQFVKQRRCAIDVGMHVGLWAMHLAKLFEKVVGFEPVSEHIECLRLNLEGVDNYEVHNCALGDRTALVGLQFFEGSSGSTQIEHIDQGIPMVPLDSFTFEAVDFVKIDVEGYEFFVVKGAEETIRKHKPVVVVEQKAIRPKIDGKGKETYSERYAAKGLLESWGARQKFDMSSDLCMAW